MADEPTNVGAVVIDAYNDVWVRNIDGHWSCQHSEACFAAIESPKVLSHGVTASHGRRPMKLTLDTHGEPLDYRIVIEPDVLLDQEPAPPQTKTFSIGSIENESISTLQAAIKATSAEYERPGAPSMLCGQPDPLTGLHCDRPRRHPGSHQASSAIGNHATWEDA